MLIEKSDIGVKAPIAIIGDGCSALSLASKAASLPNHSINIFSSQNNKIKNDHVWGYWDMHWMNAVDPITFKTWHKWIIQTSHSKTVMHSRYHPYKAVQRKNWMAHCRAIAQKNDVKFHTSLTKIDKLKCAQIFDSRPPKFRRGMMVQHFIGWEVQAPPGSFKPETAILMDFRCDQSRGVHFIYCLPFSDTTALVESTVFSTTIEPNSFYEASITNWLSDCAGIQNFKVIKTEQGAIPLGFMERHDLKFNGIGRNGGAIRPSSGYAFSFIQKQISNAILQSSSTQKKLTFVNPHKKIDLLMDRIFLSVLRNQPKMAPKIFGCLANCLTGDEFANFLSGEAGIKLRLKVIAAMPLWPFIQALFKLEEIPK
jgi:lycopene beta-cyclase